MLAIIEPISQTVVSMRGGSKPGERRGGRQKGALNKVTADVKRLAQQYGAQALQVAANIMQDVASPPAARIAAAHLLLDRGYGKPGLHVSADVVTITHEAALEEIARRAGLVTERSKLVEVT